MSMTVRGCAGEARDNHEGAKGSNDSHHITEHILLSPLRSCLGSCLRETVVDSAREELIAPIKTARLQQLLSANYAQRLEEIGTDDVLSTFTAIER